MNRRNFVWDNITNTSQSNNFWRIFLFAKQTRFVFVLQKHTVCVFIFQWISFELFIDAQRVKSFIKLHRCHMSILIADLPVHFHFYHLFLCRLFIIFSQSHGNAFTSPATSAGKTSAASPGAWEECAPTWSWSKRARRPVVSINHITSLTHRSPEIYLICVAWTWHTFKNNFGMKHKFD